MRKRTAKADQKSQPGRLRIVAGKWRSRLLQIADVPGLRPTAERIRETLFNWLTPHVGGARCLDLYAGTGALGLEALSRGAREVVLVEQSRPAADVLRANVESLDATAATVIHGDALEFLRREESPGFDVVFLDPPFADRVVGDLCRLLAGGSILAPVAWVYIEEDRAAPALDLPDGWQVMKTKNAGNVRYSLVRAAKNA